MTRSRGELGKDRRTRWRDGIGLAVLGLCLSLRVLGQPAPASAEVAASRAGKLVVLPQALRQGWLELTPLAPAGNPAVVLTLPDRQLDDPALALTTDLVGRKVMLCRGADGLAVTCEPVYLEAQAVNVVGFEAGSRVIGAYRLAGLPLAGVRVAVVPADAFDPEPFILPLGVGPSGELVREVETQSDGSFALPELAAGQYRLEAVLPTGQVQRSAVFSLDVPPPRNADSAPSAQAVPAQDARPAAVAARAAANSPIVDLGTLDVELGLDVQVQVQDPTGAPIAAAQVSATQGINPQEITSFAARTDREGNAFLRGFNFAPPVRLTCRAPGHRAVELRYDLIPALVVCTLEPLAAVRGVVLSWSGEAAAARATLIARARGGEKPSREASVVGSADTDAGGHFVLTNLTAGDYELVIAAPGHEVWTQELQLPAGQELALETVILAAAAELRGRVVDAVNQRPVAGAEIIAMEPAGAAQAVSDADGEFSISAPTSRPLTLRVTSARHAPREVVVRPSRRPLDPLVVQLERGGLIAAAVFDEVSGLPCQGCRLLIWPAGVELLTDAWGVAVSDALAAGNYRVYRPRVTHLGSTVITETAAEFQAVRVKAGRRVEVRFGDRAEAVRLRFSPALGSEWTLSLRSSGHQEKFFPAADATFELRRRPGERPEIFLHTLNRTTATEVEIWQGQLPAGATLTLPLPQTLVRGRLKTAQGPLVGQEVRLRAFPQGQLRARVHSDAQGAFYIPHVVPAVYALEVGPRTLTFLSLRPGQTLDLRTFAVGDPEPKR